MSDSLFSVSLGTQNSLYLDDDDLLSEEDQKNLYPDSHTLGQGDEKPPTFNERIKLYNDQTEKLIYNQIKESIQNQQKSNEGKIGNELIQTLSNLPVIKQIGDYNESQQVQRAYLASRARRGKDGLLVQGMQSIQDILGDTVGLPFQALEAALDVGSDTLNVDKRYLGALKDILFLAKGTKVSKSSKVYKNIQTLKGNINQGLGRSRIYTGSKDGAIPMEKTNPLRTQKVLSDYTYGGYLRDYPKGTGATGAGSGSEYIAVARAAAGQTPVAGQPHAFLSVRPAADAGAISDLVPKVHNITSKTQSKWIEKTLKPWVLKNKSQIENNKLFTNQNIGEIILDNKAKRVSTTGVQKFLDTGDTKHLVLKDSKAGVLDKRRVAADPASSVEAMRTLETANQAWLQGTKTATGKRAGVNPEFLNPKTYRAGQIRGANFTRQIISQIRNLPQFKGFDVQQGHGIDLLKSRGVDAMAPFIAETGKANRLWNRLQFGGTVLSDDAMAVLNQAGGALSEKAAAIKGKGPLATQRRLEYEQYGVLTEIWNQALLASETKGKSMKEAIKTITEYRDELAKGDFSKLQADFKIPGSQVTIDDMLAIQILSLKGMDPAIAAEQVLAERLAFEWLKANGFVKDRGTLKVLQKYMKHINTYIDVMDAKATGVPKKGYRFSDSTTDEITKYAKSRPGKYQKLPSQATGK